MFDSLELIRINFVGRPLLISLVLMPVIVLGARWCGESLGVAALFAYVAIVVYYARDPHYYDSAEPTMTAVGWLFEIGRPIHHRIDSAERYAHIYGPMAFISHGLAMGLFGPSVAVSKWLGTGGRAFPELRLVSSEGRTWRPRR